MKRRVGRAMTLAFVLAGCGGGELEGECAVDLDCGGGEICLAERCRAVCGSDGTCDGHGVCDEVAGVCVEPCGSDSECGGGEVCDSTTNRCMSIGPRPDGGTDDGFVFEPVDGGIPDGDGDLGEDRPDAGPSECMAGWAWCDGTCVPEGPLACGASCVRCEAPANGSTDCVSGACVTACDAGFETCATGCCEIDNPPPTGCGDGVCAGGETCANCRLDCLSSCGAPAFVSEPVDHSMQLSTFPTIGARAGRVFVGYNTIDGQLRLAEKTSGGWDTEAVPTATSTSSPDMVLDSRGRPWLGHTRGSDREVWVSWRDGTTWRHEAPRGVESTIYPSLAIDAADVLHLAATRSDPVRHAVRTGVNMWTVEDVSSGGADVGMAVDGSGVPIFAYDRFGFLTASCYVSWWTPADYAGHSLGGCGFWRGRKAAIAASGSTYVAIFPSETTAQAHVRNGAGWSVEPIPTVGTVKHVNLVTDGRGRIHGVIADEALYYVSRSPSGAWSAMLLANSSGSDGADIAVDDTGGIHVAFADEGRLSYGVIR